MKNIAYIISITLLLLAVFFSSQALEITVDSAQQENIWYKNNIIWEFLFPESSFTEFEWEYSPWSDCSPECGPWSTQMRFANACKWKDDNLDYPIEACASIAKAALIRSCPFLKCIEPICPRDANGNMIWTHEEDGIWNNRFAFCRFQWGRDSCPQWWGLYRYYNRSIASNSCWWKCWIGGSNNSCSTSFNPIWWNKNATCPYIYRSKVRCKKKARTCYANMVEVGCVPDDRIPKCGPANAFYSYGRDICDRGAVINSRVIRRAPETPAYLPSKRVYYWREPYQYTVWVGWKNGWDETFTWYRYYEHNGVRNNTTPDNFPPVPISATVPAIPGRILESTWSCGIDLFEVECRPYNYVAPPEESDK